MKESCLKLKKNVFSQNGEDGIIEYIFSKMNIKNGNFIEFGAWDGVYLSNCYKLFLENWSGIYIEANNIKYQQLVKNFERYDRVTCVNAIVGFDEQNNLDTIIEKSKHANTNFDFISIDVDGLDYYILKAMDKYLPKVICIEVNAGHHPLYDKEIPPNIAYNNIGQSMKIISDYAKTKDYFPLCYTGNLFLIKNEYMHLFDDDIKSLKEIYIDFLKHHTKDGLEHLRKTFVVNTIYNGFHFENAILKVFCENVL